MATVQISTEKKVKKMKPMHGGGQPPLGASDGVHHALMIANLTGKKQELNLEGVNSKTDRYYVLDQERLLSWSPNARKMDKNAVILN